MGIIFLMRANTKGDGVAGKNALLTRDYAILRGPYTFIPLLKLPISTALFGSDSVRALGTDIRGTMVAVPSLIKWWFCFLECYEQLSRSRSATYSGVGGLRFFVYVNTIMS